MNKKLNLRMVGILRLPENFDLSENYPAVVVTGPMLSVKEQAQSVYATRLTENGYVTLVFDGTYFGESEGFPRGQELPDVKELDIESAVDFLVSLPFVDKDRIGGLLTWFAISNSNGFGIVWRYFSWSNQTLAMIALWVATAYLIKKGKYRFGSLITALPATFMSAVSMTYILMASEGFRISGYLPVTAVRTVGSIFGQKDTKKKGTKKVPFFLVLPAGIEPTTSP